MHQLGVSVYPDLRPMEEIAHYLKLVSSYGFKRVFSSMFSVEGTKEEVIDYFTKLIEIAHDVDMTVSLDVNPQCLENVGATAKDISIFHKMKCDILRMDLSFGLENDLALLKNPYGILIEFNASIMSGAYIEQLKDNGTDPEKMLVCHNFYPQRYTGMKWEKFKKQNEDFKKTGVRVGAFVSSHAENTHGVWDATCGLPTVEKMRDLPIDLQVRELIATGSVTDILIGNAYASEEELKSIQEAISIVEAKPDNPMIALMKSFGGTMDMFVKKISVQKKVRITLEETISEIEKDILFNFFPHSDVGDSSEWIWRSRMPRFIYKKQTVPVRPYDKERFEVGDVVIVNNNYKNYAGEVQIVLQPIMNDGTRNKAGHLDAQEFEMMELIHEQDVVIFLEKE